MRRAGILICLVAFAGLVGCGASLPSSGGADASGGQDRCAPEIPAPVVPGETCLYTIPYPPCADTDIAHIGIKVDGLEIPRDPLHMDGWDYTEASGLTFQIYGPRCDALTAGSATAVSIVFKMILI